MGKGILNVEKRYLLLTAGVVWFIAGSNIVRIGWSASNNSWNILSVLVACGVFGIFFTTIFSKLITKHARRIRSYTQLKVSILRFFDKKSYMIMFFMMTFGILLRKSNLLPGYCIKVFYCGLGLALVAAGIGFFVEFLKLRNECQEEVC